MKKEISLQITQPDKTVLAGSYPAVIIPAAIGNLTVIPERAPSLVLLTNGMVQLLDENSKITAKYFVQGGVASIAVDKCVVSSERVIEKSKISLEEAIVLLEQAENETDKAFYQVVVDELTAFPK